MATAISDVLPGSRVAHAMLMFAPVLEMGEKIPFESENR